ncbi:RpiR family transcriptional regulator (plasmid) [Rhizobium leguminosarum bv. trifolii CB782]|uniref:MurR/RpiR family transcriptional regulator n=1 Tax=Rhizobium hidalgonense TaxID=1538159 RepID=A0A2A6K8C9_9HYPH|nr:MurR/RpiR family transcriptional regulator [Rhizobium hidalgonense]AHG49709.1 RpiR family transcriptional regulator [Rhizobium leguminosarum bv. trifolii CB782]MDR9773025.1 MurR/RpiR family transcriptional regulator [Rhizobium hidalgonense]MDR9813527.1 MurR/RpiR family transcriptional regulator [Rhizobium hidalgonense]MDR9821961.1 MurR/RpiR family transcriptional regulator [Rhizobium hidalgonense]PDT20701.1 MurR/RpiR family transcriptional regulator [Rhizobium hidalgonense]
MDIFSTLQEDKSRLSPSESRIAEIIVNDFEFAVNASIIELAERAEVSPPTVTRFCRRLGCESFSDFKVQLARTAHIGVRYLKPESKSTDPADVAQDIITKAQNALFLLHRSLDLAAIEAAVSHIAKADMIYAFGSGGNSSMIADELQNRLFRLGLRITASSDHSMQLMMAAAARPGDVLIGSSFSGRNMELVRAFELARDTKVKTIALTQTESPVAKAAEIVVPIDLPEGNNIYRPTSTRIAYLATVDILSSLVAYAVQPKATTTLRRIKQQLVIHRDGDDRQLLGD